MSKILVSWSAYKNDFVYNNKTPDFNEEGPHGELYASKEFKYDKHYLLLTARELDDDIKMVHLVNFLSNTKKTEVIPVPLDIKNPVDVSEIKQKVMEFLLDLRGFNLEIFVSPGTPSMQTVWYLLAGEKKQNQKYFYTLPPRDRKEKAFEKTFFEAEYSNYTESILIRNSKLKSGSFNSETLNHANLLADRIASIKTNKVITLITGESGTGKEIIAKRIRDRSFPKPEEVPFIKINCGAFSDTLLESRLFGHVKGAFTDANEKKEGAFQEANGGVLFLDEIGEVSIKMQQTLLRVLQERVVYKIGSYKAEKVDVRIICATNQDLWQKVQEKEFRSDLFYRINVANIELPPLFTYTKKEKKALINYFNKLASQPENFARKVLVIEPEVIDFLLDYRFSGNIRELENLIDRWYTFCSERVTVKDIPPFMKKKSISKSLKMVDVENNHIQEVMNMFPNNKKRVYETLGITYNGLMKRVKKYNLNFTGAIKA